MRGVAVLACLCLLAGCAGAPTTGTAGPATDATTTTATAGAMPGTLAGADAPAPPDGETVTVTVREVVDGDTVDVVYENGTRDTVRLLGVDTPEVHAEVSPDEFGVPDTEAGRACLRTWGERASAFAKDRLAGRTITLHFDPNTDRRGYYGRLLAYVTVEGDHFNYRLVRQGYARVYDSDFALKSAFLRAASRARHNGTGVWSCAADEDGGGETSTATARDGPLAVSVHADAPGNDHENLNGEYVVFENRGTTALALGGWTVSDAAGHTYTFDALELEPGTSVTLYTGSGTDTQTARYWGADGAVWNNGGDTVVLRDPGGSVVLEYAYEG